MFAPIGGATHYYGGETQLVARVAEEVASTGGPGYRMGLALGPFAARRAADLATGDEPLFIVEDDHAFLTSLDVSSVGSEDLAATFRWLGITTLGEVAELPRDAVMSRFGMSGADGSSSCQR